MARRQPKRFMAAQTTLAPGVKGKFWITFRSREVLLPFSMASLSSALTSGLAPLAPLAPLAVGLAAGSPASFTTRSMTSSQHSTCDRPKTTKDLPLGLFMASHHRAVTSAP